MRSVWGRFAVASLLAGILAVMPARGADGEPYQKISVLLPVDTMIRDLLSVHPDLEVMGRGEASIELLSRPSLTRMLRDRGWEVTILQPDLEAAYAASQPPVADYGVWHTYAEMVAELNLLHQQFPNVTAAPVSLGRTIENRDIWAMKISDNPNVQENEPEVLHDSVIHAREIMTIEMTLHFMRYLCENYGTDPVATFLVDNRQIWFVPVVNPDGFVYNEATNPNGGGMWRKNRRNNGGCYGVDNNRNFPYQWVGNGSSTNPCDDTYRGPSAGSEAENQALMNLANAHDFVTHDSWHSVAGMILYPWGYTTGDTPDHSTFVAIAAERARDNGYSLGQPPELLYPVNGVSMDWFYGDTANHPKVFSFTTEIGGSDFWPNPAERDGLIAENMHSIIYLTQVAGPSASVIGLAVSGGNGNGRIEPGEAVDMVATIKNDGIFSALSNITIRLRCDDPYVALTDANDFTGNLNAGQTYANNGDPFNLSVDGSCPPGRRTTFTVVVDASDGIHVEAPFIFEIGQLPVIASNTFEASSDWTQDASHTAATGAFVRVDPVATAYQPGDDTTPAPGVNAWITAQNPSGADGTDDVDDGVSATRSPDFNLASYLGARLSLNYFHGQRDTGDDAADYFRIGVSSDAGASWVNLVSIGDAATPANWRNLTVDLTDYIALTSQVRLRVQAADGPPSAGMGDIIEAGIDDLYFYDTGVPNDAPGAPVLVAPPDGAINQPSIVTLTVANATDPEGDALTYGFRVYSDPDLTQLVQSVDGVAEGAGGTTSWTTGQLGLGTFYWRAHAADPYQRGLSMRAARFTVNQLVAVGDAAPAANRDLAVEPNPARGGGGMKIRYFVPATSTSKLGIYDPQGRLVRTLDHVPSAAGWHDVVWDGRDEQGTAVASGTYWVRLWTPEETRTIRVVRVD